MIDIAAAGTAGTVSREIVATLQTGESVVGYRRAGSGSCLITIRTASEPIVGECFAALATRFRVVAVVAERTDCESDPDPDAARLTEWIDALGVERCHLLASPRWAPAALELARSTGIGIQAVAYRISDGEPLPAPEGRRPIAPDSTEIPVRAFQPGTDCSVLLDWLVVSAATPR